MNPQTIAAGTPRRLPRLNLLAAVLLVLSALPQLHAADEAVVDFGRDVLPILKARCAECHKGDAAKNDYHVLQKESMLGYVEPESAADSSLWTDYLMAPSREEDEESLIMPPSGRLPAGELAVLKVWIDEGAVWPEELADAETPAAAPAVAASTAAAVQPADSQRYIIAFGYLHPAIVHFPIAILLVGGLAGALTYVTRSESIRQCALICLIIGAVTAVASSVAGWGFAMERGYGTWAWRLPEGASDQDSLIYRHRWYGVGTTALALGLAAVAVVSQVRRSRGHLWRAGLVGCAVLVGLTGHQGGELVYGDVFDKAMIRLGWIDAAARAADEKAEREAAAEGASP